MKWLIKYHWRMFGRCSAGVYHGLKGLNPLVVWSHNFSGTCIYVFSLNKSFLLLQWRVKCEMNYLYELRDSLCQLQAHWEFMTASCNKPWLLGSSKSFTVAIRGSFSSLNLLILAQLLDDVVFFAYTGIPR